ncbi:MAG: hypothetical protein WD963_02190 [Candidatus Paceibacterota bacterium]
MESQEPQIKFTDPIDAINKKLDKFFWVLFSVGFVFVVTLIIMVINILIDSSHFNSATYKEYSQKTESVENTQKINQELLDQNKKNQEVIIELHKQLLKK